MTHLPRRRRRCHYLPENVQLQAEFFDHVLLGKGELDHWPPVRAEVRTGYPVQGTDIKRYPKPLVYSRHQSDLNRGPQLLHTGGRYPSHLAVPVVTTS